MGLLPSAIGYLRQDVSENPAQVAIDRLGVDAVIVPSTEHFDDHVIPAELLAVATVITVSPGSTTARTPQST
ncbi:hypothetical protein VMT65_11325 [Nocardia sp. CDC153]|uniref:hypothetical protein n=1 Tax=Nocardia sp. CDC153 TaxID=3112167 RepID=UPI002DB8A54B|nr:hypothetical protein [Nocardia sp. CDC153]MEC3953624.1 hypothetical protein [Nocardia sp. CDC153]